MKIEPVARERAESAGSLEPEYFRALFRLLEGLDVPATKDYGLAVFALIDHSTVTLRDGTTLPLGHVGGKPDIALAIAAAFSTVHPDPELWKKAYLWQIPEGALQVLPEVEAQLRALPLVMALSPRS